MRYVAAIMAAAWLQTGVLAPAIGAQTRNCLHGSQEAQADKQRREAAIKFARAVIDAETAAKRSGSYLPASKLPKLPEAPSGFKIQVTTDGNAFAFSAKDMLDVCGFALFSDHDGFIYEASPVNRPGIRLLTGE